jgi:site-specific DNA-methyltransferase (adenine-specific)
MYLHLDWRWVHYAKVECDKIFGYDNFLNHIVWSYNFGGRGKDRWPTKHDDILVYTKEIGRHTFNWKDADRIPYAAPALQYVGRTKEEAEKRIAEGQVPTDVWEMSIVGTASKERLGYPNQKPVKLIKRAIVASSNVDDVILDPFAGCGTTAAAALECGRQFIVGDKKREAFDVMKKRFDVSKVDFVE